MKQYVAGLILLLSLLVYSVSPVMAAEWRGMDIVRFCTGDTVLFDESTCRAYVQGIIDTHELYKSEEKHPESFCVPSDKAEREKGESMVPKWLAAFPKKWRQKPVDLIVNALNDIFRCRKK